MRELFCLQNVLAVCRLRMQLKAMFYIHGLSLLGCKQVEGGDTHFRACGHKAGKYIAANASATISG